MTNIITETLKKYIFDQNTSFVFATQIECNLWMDKVLEITDAEAIAKERFLAWDDFKGQAVKCRTQDKDSIPSIMRKVFAAKLIDDNSREKFLEDIITKEYAECAEGFQDWIAGILPSLQSWKEKYEESIKNRNHSTDAEDRDYLELYTRYSAFLDANGLFDPAWERPPFAETEIHYIIFYPESLMDWSEYREILESSRTIELVHMPAENIKSSVNYYENIRVELRETALAVKKAHIEDGIPWTDIAVSVPDLENYEPYLMREFEQYEIPVNARMGSKLGMTGAGNLFAQIAECFSKKYSYESVKSLFMNLSLPWDKEKNQIKQLLEFGRINNCLYSYSYNGKDHDIWNDSFKNPKDNSEPVSQLVENLYKALKKHTEAICKAESFSKIKDKYMEFKNNFLDVEKFSEESNRILSRCIKELDSLIDVEEKFKDVKINSPFNFLVNHLKSVVYVSQDSTPGVHVYSYRNAACAPFKLHILINASQDSLSVDRLYKNLGFINDNKRREFGIEDNDPTVTFIKMYAGTSDKVIFSAAEKTIDGYSFPHGYFEWVEKRPKEIKDGKPELAYDICRDEEESLSPSIEEQRYEYEAPGKQNSFSKNIYASMKNEFARWTDTTHPDSKKTEISDEAKKDFAETAKQTLMTKDGKIKVTKSLLDNYFSCPRKFLFDSILGIAPLNDAEQLMDQYFMGDFTHFAFENFLKTLRKRQMQIMGSGTGLPDEYENIFEETFAYSIDNFETSAITREILKSRISGLKQDVHNSIIRFSDIFSGYNVYAVEDQKWLNYIPQANPDCKYIGRIDCILEKPEKNNTPHSFVIVDFKGGNVPAKCLCEKEDEIPDFQMPLYVTCLDNMLMKQFNTDEKLVSGFAYFSYASNTMSTAYGCITNLATDETFYPAVSEDLSVEEATRLTFENFEKCVSQFLEAVKDGQYELENGESNVTYAGCKECGNYRALCRRFFTVSGRE